jgi:hypothetical protein
MNLIRPINTLSAANREKFEDIQWKAWNTAVKLNPLAAKFGFNINSSYQNEVYSEDEEQPNIAPGNLTWSNFIEEFPDYVKFLDEYHFYHGCTMLSRAVAGPHRHGSGQLTFTYPLAGCNGLKVQMVMPKNIADEEKWWLNNGEEYLVLEEFVCRDGYPFMLPANRFHKTDEAPIFQNGKTIITVWHSMMSNNPDHYGSIQRYYNLLEFPNEQ